MKREVFTSGISTAAESTPVWLMSLKVNIGLKACHDAGLIDKHKWPKCVKNASTVREYNTDFECS